MTACDKLIAKLSLQAGEAVAIHNPSNMFYLTEGYTGEGALYISAARRVIVTDSRYTEQAGRQAPAFAVEMTATGRSHSAIIAELCRADGVTSLRYEDDYLTVAAYQALKEKIGDTVVLSALKQAPEKLRELKTEAEIACIREACRISSETFEQLIPKIHEGITEKELAIELDFLHLKLGAQTKSFDTIMAFGENGSLPHAIPGERKLRRGDMITMDFGCKVGNYCSDCTRDVAFGDPGELMRRVYDVVKETQAMCREAVAPGKSCFDIDKMARDNLARRGFEGKMGHGLGHAVGIDIHENPRFSPTCHDTLQENIVITVEPGIYLPGVGGVRIEDTVLVTATGYESLTTATRDLIIL